MNPINLDLNFLIQKKGESLIAESESHSKETSVDRDIRLNEFEQQFAGSEPSDMALILSNRRTPSKFVPEGIEETHSRGNGNHNHDEVQSELMFDINEGDLISMLERSTKFDNETEQGLPLEQESTDGESEAEFVLQDLDVTTPTIDLERLDEHSDFQIKLDPSYEPLILPKEPGLEEHAEDEKELILEREDLSILPEEPLFETKEFSLQEEFGDTSSSGKEGVTTVSKLQFIEHDRKESSTNVETPQKPGDLELPSEEKEEPFALPKRPTASKTDKKKFIKSEDNKDTPAQVLSSGKQSRQSVLKASFSLSSIFEKSQLLGLDIGTRSLKYVILKKAAGGLKLIHCGIRPIPKASEDADEEEQNALISQVLQQTLKSKSLKNTLVTSSVSGLEVMFHNVQVPKMARKDLNKAVPWACRKDFPFPIESGVIEFKIIEDKHKESRGKLDVLVIGAQESLVSKHVGILTKAHIAPAKVSTVPVALWNVFRLLVKKDVDKCYAVIDIGAISSHIVMINRGQIEFAREITTGGDDFSEALTGSIFIDGKEIVLNRNRANQIKKEYGFSDSRKDGCTEEGIPLKEVSVMMGPVLERLVNDIQRTIEFYKEKFQIKVVEKILLTGGGSFVKNLCPNLARELNLKVEILNPFDLLCTRKIANQHELQKLGPRFAVSVGLALDTSKDLNLLPQQLKGAHTFQYIKRIFRYLFVIVILLMTLLSQNISQQVTKIEREFKRIRKEYKMAEPKRQQYVELQKRLTTLKTTYDSYKSKLEVNLSASNHLRVISHLIPRNIALTSLKIEHRDVKIKEKESQVISREIVILTGVAFENNFLEGINLAKFLLELEKSDYFSEIALRNQRIREDGGLDFVIECQI
ncbi:MAG: type IV pilus assembly protein PilM [bacterium]